jgi:hypothetical protein
MCGHRPSDQGGGDAVADQRGDLGGVTCSSVRVRGEEVRGADAQVESWLRHIGALRG